VNGVEFIVPALWPFEVANALYVAERRGRIPSFRIAELFSLLLDLPVFLEPVASRYVFERIFSVAHRTRLSIYDASYLELALARRLPLATLDNVLLKAAQHMGVRVWSAEI
jgi:predicted nucleic acid-binding protein